MCYRLLLSFVVPGGIKGGSVLVVMLPQPPSSARHAFDGMRARIEGACPDIIDHRARVVAAMN